MPLATVRNAAAQEGKIVKIERQLRFDYKQLDQDDQADAMNATLAIFQKIDAIGQSIYDIGLHLIEQKERLGHGHFLPWLETELGWDDRRAQLLMSIPKRFSREEYDPLKRLAPSTQQLLAAPSTPDDAITAVLAASEDNPDLTVREVKEIIKEVKIAQNPPSYVAPGVPLTLSETLTAIRAGIAPMSADRALNFLRQSHPSKFSDQLPTGHVFDGVIFDDAVVIVRGELTQQQAQQKENQARAVYVAPAPPPPTVITPAATVSAAPQPPANGAMNRTDAIKLKLGWLLGDLLERMNAQKDGETAAEMFAELANIGAIPISALDSWADIAARINKLAKLLDE